MLFGAETWVVTPTWAGSCEGFQYQVAPKSITDWTTALKKNPDARGAAPSLMRIFVNLRHTACNFARFLTTAGQSPSAADITCPNYLKEATIYRGRPYALKELDVTALSSSAARRSLFRPPPLLVLHGAPMHPNQSSPWYQHVAHMTPWVGEVTLLQYHHGVPDVPVPEMHPHGCPHCRPATTPLNWAGP